MVGLHASRAANIVIFFSSNFLIVEKAQVIGHNFRHF